MKKMGEKKKEAVDFCHSMPSGGVALTRLVSTMRAYPSLPPFPTSTSDPPPLLTPLSFVLHGASHYRPRQRAGRSAERSALMWDHPL